MSAIYRAIRLEGFARTFREASTIVELPITDPGPGEIRVRNRYCGVNGIFDTQIARNAVDYVKSDCPHLPVSKPWAWSKQSAAASPRSSPATRR